MTEAFASPLAEPGPGGWQPLTPPAATAGPVSERLDIVPGFSAIRSRSPGRQHERHTHPGDATALVLTFGLAGASEYRSRDGEHLQFRAGHTTVATLRGSEGERRFPGDRPVAQLRLRVDGPLAERLIGPAALARLLPRHGVRALALLPTPPACAARALALYRHRCASALDHLDGQALALGLLTEQLRTLGWAPPEAPPVPPHRDSERLQQARDLIHSQWHRDLRLAELCQATGMSETRLKRGFRECFGTSPGQMLLQARMEQALRLLQGGCQVAQAAWQVGYRHPANFSTAFARHFGRPPKQYASIRAPAP